MIVDLSFTLMHPANAQSMAVLEMFSSGNVKKNRTLPYREGRMRNKYFYIFKVMFKIVRESGVI